MKGLPEFGLHINPMNPLDSLDLNTLSQLSPPVLLMLFLNLVGFGLNKTDYISNKWIPLILFSLGGILYPMIGIVEASQRHPVIHLAIIGCIIGAAAVGTNQLYRQIKGPGTSITNEPK